MKNLKRNMNANSMQCESCDKPIKTQDLYFKSTNGDILCEECGDKHLFIHNLTVHDDYPYVKDEDFDGGQYQGDPYKPFIL